MRLGLLKKRKNFSPKLFPVRLNFLVAKGMAMVAMQMFKISCKITSKATVKNVKMSNTIEVEFMLETLILSC